MMNFTCRIPVILAIVILSGCATGISDHTATKSHRLALWEQQQINNANISSWALTGKIGVKTGSKGGTATLHWAYLAGAQEIQLYGPFGGGRVQITTTADSATLEDTRGGVIQGESADEVLYRRLGWQVPFTGLVKWCRGIPDDNATDIEIDGAGRLKSLNQGIWHVEYQQYVSVDALTLPAKLTITSRPGALDLYDEKGRHIGDELRVKLILKRWRGIDSK